MESVVFGSLVEDMNTAKSLIWHLKMKRIKTNKSLGSMQF